ncbi:MAG: hypothetical protein H0U99_09735 [Chthoniobacterales bacterium]|nr:hypothetical protein [Chthoniobacterales bacterium]
MRQLFGCKYETFDAPAGRDRIDDLRYVADRYVTVEKMIRLNQDGHTGGALVETARGTSACVEPGKVARFELFFECAMDCLGAARSTATFFVAIGPSIGADKEIARSLRHGAGWQPTRPRSTGTERSLKGNIL